MTINIYVTEHEKKEIKREAKRRKISISNLLMLGLQELMIMEEMKLGGGKQ